MTEKIYELSADVDLISLFGSFDHNIKLVEKNTSTQILNRGDHLKICGEEANVEKSFKIMFASM